MTDKIFAFVERLKVNPDNRFDRYNLAQAYFEQDEYQNAIIHFKRCLEHSNDWMLVNLFLGKCYLALKEHKEAKDFLERTMYLAKQQNHEDPLNEAESLLKECIQG